MASVYKRGGGKAKGYWYAAWVDARGKRQTKCTRTTDKATAERIARKHEAGAALRRDGVIDAALEAISTESRRSIESHVVDYENKLKAAGRDPQYINETAKYIRQIAAAGGFEAAADINADAVFRFAADLKSRKMSARTVQAHLTAIKGFTRWLAENSKIARDPLLSVKKPSPQADRRRERRALQPDEWAQLQFVTRTESARYGMTGKCRALLYELAIQTGLRAGELASLTCASLHLNGKEPYVVCRAGSTKNGKDARLYVSAPLAEELRKLVARKSPAAAVFDLPHSSNLARMLREDLEAARSKWIELAKRDARELALRKEGDFLRSKCREGTVLDFHSLRHTCGAWLAMAGNHPKVVQTVMRHSTITLTMDTYGHLFPGQEIEAIGKVQAMLADDGPELHRATGTAQSVGGYVEVVQRRAQRGPLEERQSGASGCNEGERTGGLAEERKSLRIADLSEATQEDASQSESAPSRARTLNLLIKSQLLCQLS